MFKISKDLAAIIFGEAYDILNKRTAIKIEPSIYDAYVGEYEIRQQFIRAITKEDNRIWAVATGQNQFDIFPESEINFFNNEIYLVITFIKDEA